MNDTKTIYEPYSGEKTIITKEEELIYSDDPYDYEEIEHYNEEDDDWDFIEPSEASVYDIDHFYDYRRDEYLFIMSELDNHNYYVVSGYFGGWRGHQEGVWVSKDKLLDIISHLCVNSASSIVSIYKKGEDTLVVYNRHHDGCSRYEIKALSKEGEQFVIDNCDDMSTKDMVDTLFSDSKYTTTLQ